MAIEVQVPREITAYQAKVVMGMSWRQLACAAAMVIFGGGTILVGYMTGFGETSQYLAVVLIVPFAALGWYRPRGIPFEKYAGYIITHKRSRPLYVYGLPPLIQNPVDGSGTPKKATRNTEKGRKGRKTGLPRERDTHA